MTKNIVKKSALKLVPRSMTKVKHAYLEQFLKRPIYKSSVGAPLDHTCKILINGGFIDISTDVSGRQRVYKHFVTNQTWQAHALT